MFVESINKMAKRTHSGPHKYRLVNIGKIDKPIKVYACSLPNCTHHMPAHSERLLIGKETLCNQCLTVTIMTADIVGRHIVKPRCYDCMRGIKKQGSKPQEVLELDGALDMLLKMKL